MNQGASDTVDIYPSRHKAWTILLAGCVLAQSLVTLVTIAPGPWETAGLLAFASIFVVPIAKGAWLLSLKGPILSINSHGVTLTPARQRLDIPWAGIERFDLLDGKRRRVTLTLADPGAYDRCGVLYSISRRINRATRRADIVFSPWDIDGSLTDLFARVTQHRDFTVQEAKT